VVAVVSTQTPQPNITGSGLEIDSPIVLILIVVVILVIAVLFFLLRKR
jgi:hypothetical protein